MSVQAPAPKPNKIVWALAAILCACTLVALWVTGARIKALKLAARRGETIEPAAAPPAGGRLVLRRDARARVEHFGLQLNARGNVEVLDAAGRPLVEFLQLAKGQLRGWQELQLVCVEATSETTTVEAEIKPGAKCFGSGRYRALRPGLQIEFGRNRAVTVTAWDPRTPELGLKFQTQPVDLERKIALDGKGEVFKVSYHLQREPDGELALVLENLD
jgi:hypothetical protein